jgi:hypothetical protein
MNKNTGGHTCAQGVTLRAQVWRLNKVGTNPGHTCAGVPEARQHVGDQQGTRSQKSIFPF